MPTRASFLLEAPPSAAIITASTEPPVFGSAIICDAEYFDKAYLLRLVDRSYPTDYIFSLKNKKNGGYEVFQAAAAVGERVSKAIAELECCAYLTSANGGVKASGTIEFYRTDATAGEITIIAGTVVTTSKSKKDFIVLNSVSFGIGELGPKTANIEAVAFGPEFNVPGQVITAGNEVIPGEIDSVKLLHTEVPVIDPAMRVRQIVATSGGTSACLDGIGEDYLIPRNPLEPDDAYRLRIQETPDTVSPAAIIRGVNKFLTPIGSSACLREVGTFFLPGFYYDAGSSTSGIQNPAYMFAYDTDPLIREGERWKVYLNKTEMRGYFLVGVPPVVATDYGMAYDGGSADAFPLKNAYDTVARDASNAAFDGSPYLQSSLYRSIWDIVEAKRAGGVGFDLYIETAGCVSSQP